MCVPFHSACIPLCNVKNVQVCVCACVCGAHVSPLHTRLSPALIRVATPSSSRLNLTLAPDTISLQTAGNLTPPTYTYSGKYVGFSGVIVH